METFDITMTATLRPELIERTLKSFYRNLFKEWLRYAQIYVNVDCAGCEDWDLQEHLQNQIQDILDGFFYPNKPIINYPNEPDFPTAWFWCMDNTKSRLVFHLEEDWEMNFEQDFEEMYGMFYKYPKLKHLRLSQFVSTDESTKMWGRHFARWNGDFYEIEEKSIISVGWCGHPSLNDGEWLRSCAKLMDRRKNPEKQFHYNRKVVKEGIMDNMFGVFHKRGQGRGIRDTGREWMREHGYKKMGGANAEWFTHWEKEKKDEKDK